MGRQFEEDHVRRMVRDVLYSAGPVQAVVHRGTQAAPGEDLSARSLPLSIRPASA
jgi:hypothetical protein